VRLDISLVGLADEDDGLAPYAALLRAALLCPKAGEIVVWKTYLDFTPVPSIAPPPLPVILGEEGGVVRAVKFLRNESLT
jgi:hypothetical protein